jgi:GAF domain
MSIEQTRWHINRLVNELAELSEQRMPATHYYHELLKRVRRALAAPAGAVWAVTPLGHLQLQSQAKLKQVGIDQSDVNRQTHVELLWHTASRAQPALLAPHSSVDGEFTGPVPGNPTDYLVLLVPIVVDNVVAGLVEVFQQADRNPAAHRGYLNFLQVIATLAARYVRNRKL